MENLEENEKESQQENTAANNINAKVNAAIKRLQSFEPEEGYYLCFSGGKDSQCIYHLAKMAGVKFDAHYTVTTVDPPEVVRFIHFNYPDVQFEHHGSMRQIIMNKGMMPSRMARFCCSELKETGGKGRIVITGVRWAESPRRKNGHGAVTIITRSKKLYAQAEEIEGAHSNVGGNGVIMNDDNDQARRMVEQCYRTLKTMVNPIIDWSDDDVWNFLDNVAKVPHCSLYDEGYTRIGCIGCPIANKKKREREFERWPAYERMYRRCIKELLERNKFEKIAPPDLPMEEREKIVWEWWMDR